MNSCGQVNPLLIFSITHLFLQNRILFFYWVLWPLAILTIMDLVDGCAGIRQKPDIIKYDWHLDIQARSHGNESHSLIIDVAKLFVIFFFYYTLSLN